jgi:hypothetical protein
MSHPAPVVPTRDGATAFSSSWFGPGRSTGAPRGLLHLLDLSIVDAGPGEGTA